MGANGRFCFTDLKPGYYIATRVDHDKPYPYVGYIPNFPELGHFGGLNEPKIYVFFDKELASKNSFIPPSAPCR
jgi:hypothetical protein